MEAFEGTNVGGLKSVKIILLVNLAFPENQNPIDFDSILTLNGANFEEIPLIFESGNFSDSEEKSRAGNFWSKKITFRIAKLRKEVSAMLLPYAGRKLAAYVTDNNGTDYLVYPLRMLQGRDVPAQVAGLNATSIELAGKSVTESPVVVITESA
jgi:hypothetical protein